MTYTIDHIAEGVAVLEAADGTFHEVPADDLPAGAGEGTVLERSDGKWNVRHDLTAERRRRVRNKLDRLRKR